MELNSRLNNRSRDRCFRWINEIQDKIGHSQQSIVLLGVRSIKQTFDGHQLQFFASSAYVLFTPHNLKCRAHVILFTFTTNLFKSDRETTFLQKRAYAFMLVPTK